MTDRYRQAVYRAEDQWSATIDRGGSVDFFGSVVDVPVQLRFGSLPDVQAYVSQICQHVAVESPRVRHRKGGRRAHYRAGEIAIPSDQPWAMRESVVLHELAHHLAVLTADDHTHGTLFVTSMLSLVSTRLGDEAHLLLRTGYASVGVPIEVSS